MTTRQVERDDPVLLEQAPLGFPTIVNMQPHLPVTKPTVGSFFAGIGGIDLGFEDAGFSVVWANDIDVDSCATYRNNFTGKVVCGSITDLRGEDLNRVDVITGGFPCQAFSIAGYRKGLDDERGAIFFELMRIVKELQPKAMLLENVKNLLSHDHGATFEIVVNEIEKAGYLMKYAVLNTCDYSNLPQNRERIYMACFKDADTYSHFKFPAKTPGRQHIQDMLENSVDDDFYYKKTKYYLLLKKTVTNRDTCYQWRRKYIRENKSNLCPTLTANMGTGGHNVPLVLDSKDIRKLTPKECARLQGFPDSFKFPDNLSRAKIYKQIGNSVSVPVVKKIAENMLIALRKVKS